ncbi:hypothetical protein L2Y94_05605 [Luteibacter aegosomatis]|uniref:hypothetical protein n=1 Tax=Luteibacter aegosomatis TaxID=2911537 RepID=UPI001FFA35F0|nr:hypothetical protein [Luteibacter aegosomatis]UPG86830.1 hypothetical protein L2Y94_05605 [Luteibacter aegosomatis]
MSDEIDNVAAIAACFLRLMTPSASTEDQAHAASDLAGPVLASLCQIFHAEPGAVRARAESLMPKINDVLRHTVH